MIDFNVNENVLVKLNDYGRTELARQHEELKACFPMLDDFEPPKEDKDGWSRWQLHSLMKNFGHMMSVGREPPFETGIRIEGPHKISADS